MNENDLNYQPNYTSGELPNVVSNPTIAPNPTPSSPPTFTPELLDKEPHSSLLLGLVCGIIGLVVGGVGIFAIMKVTTPAPKCPECNCSQQTSDNTLSDLTTGFLTLESKNQNLVYSPLSIRYGLALLNAGANGETKSEITDLLDLSTLPTYTNVPDILSLANGIFINNTFRDSVLPTYIKNVTDNYGAEIIYDDFSSTANMDDWVKNKTFNLIDQIGVELQPTTEMVLTNALAIQMAWEHPFNAGDTSGANFYQDDDTKITAATMTQTTTADDIKYYADDNTTMLALPLKPAEETSLEFVAVMPSGSLADYIANLDLTTIENQLKDATLASALEAGIKIDIPKFKFNYELKFKEDLEAMGIKKAFSSEADFSNMANKPLHVSSAVHKANIDFSEEGIKASAVTAFAMDITSMVPSSEPILIKFDHPFLFLIRDKNTSAIWFIGTVYEPTPSES